MADKRWSRWWTAPAVGGLGGMVVSYLVVSPVAMLLFHKSHQAVDVRAMLEMHHSVAGAIRHAFSNELPLWWGGFSLLGLAAGAGVGGVIGVLGYRRRQIEDGAAELAATNTKLQEAYRQVVHADKLSSLGILAATVIHDINNHLALVSLIAQEQVEEPSDSSAEDWAQVALQVKAMAALTGAARRFSRRASGQREPAGLHEILDSTLTLTCKATTWRQVTVKTELAAKLPLVTGDENELTQVFVNLVQNALDAMPDGGTLRISTRDHDSKIEVRFSDSGPGIPAEVLPRIFEAFFTTKPADKGTGLGLAICRQIIEQHQGEISAGNNEDGGATFCVRLPLHAIESRSVAEAEPDGEGSGSTITDGGCA